MPNTKSGLNNVITGEIVGSVDGKMLDLCQDDSPHDGGRFVASTAKRLGEYRFFSGAFVVFHRIFVIFRAFCLVGKRNFVYLRTEKGFAPISKPEYIKINKLKKIRNALKLNQISFALRKK